jgi:type II secretory pathway component PulF
MKKYRYQARDVLGKSVFGELEACGIDEALAQLAAEGLVAERSDVRDVSSPDVARSSDRSKGRLSEEEAAELASRVAELAQAGLPLAPGLRAIAAELGGGRVSRLLVEIADRLDAGESLEDAMGIEGGRFPAHLRGLVLAGVETGHLPEMLQQYVTYQQDRSALKRRVWLSLAYPMLLLTMVLILYLFFSTCIVPAFNKIYVDFGTELPAITQLLIVVCRPSMRFLLCLPAFLFYVMLLLSTTQLPVWGRRVLYAVPLLGPLWRLSGMASFARLLALLVEQEVPLPQALRYAAEGLRAPDLTAACFGAARQVQGGRSLGEAMAGYWQFLPTLRSFADWGQRGECLADALRAAGDVFERRLRVQTRLFDIILPAILFIIVLGFISLTLIALFMPLISLITTLSG